MRERSRPSTPNSTDSAPKLPSLAMERIKIHNTAALDRMTAMQQRYQQHQEMISSNNELNRRNSSASQFEETNVSVQCIQYAMHMHITKSVSVVFIMCVVYFVNNNQLMFNHNSSFRIT